MKITAITFEGINGTTATATKLSGGKEAIQVTFHSSDSEILVDADSEDQIRMLADELQERMDGYIGLRETRNEYFIELCRIANI